MMEALSTMHGCFAVIGCIYILAICLIWSFIAFVQAFIAFNTLLCDGKNEKNMALCARQFARYGLSAFATSFFLYQWSDGQMGYTELLPFILLGGCAILASAICGGMCYKEKRKIKKRNDQNLVREALLLADSKYICERMPLKKDGSQKEKITQNIEKVALQVKKVRYDKVRQSGENLVKEARLLVETMADTVAIKNSTLRELETYYIPEANRLLERFVFLEKTAPLHPLTIRKLSAALDGISEKIRQCIAEISEPDMTDIEVSSDIIANRLNGEFKELNIHNALEEAKRANDEHHAGQGTVYRVEGEQREMVGVLYAKCA